MLIDGEYISVTAKGSGKPVLLLHGYLSCKESFYYQQKALIDAGYYAVAPDMPAFGCSASIQTPWSVGDYACWLKKFIEVFNLRGAHIVAHSFGARVAIKALSEDCTLADKLIITGGAGIVKPRSKEYIKSVKRYRLIKKLFPRYAERHFGSKEYKTLSPVMKESYKKIVNEDLRDCASKVLNRTLLIYGKDDGVTPPDEEGKIFNSQICGSTLKIIEGDHFCFSQSPQTFNNLMLTFFKG